MMPIVIEARANTRTESAKIRNRRIRKKVKPLFLFKKKKMLLDDVHSMFHLVSKDEMGGVDSVFF